MSIEKPKYGLKRFCVILKFIVPAYGVHPSVILIIAEKKIIESSEDFFDNNFRFDLSMKW